MGLQVVHDAMQIQALGCLGHQVGQELVEIGGPGRAGDQPRHRPFVDVQARERHRRAVATVGQRHVAVDTFYAGFLFSIGAGLIVAGIQEILHREWSRRPEQGTRATRRSDRPSSTP